jgi:tetratricopeptide (TPR) repeat protein
LVAVLGYEGRFDEAKQLGESILEPARSALGDSNDTRLSLVYTMAQVYADQGDFARSDSIYGHLTADMRRYKGDEYPATLAIQVAYGWMLRLADRPSEAEAITRRSLETMRRVLGNEHPETQIAVNNLGIILNDLGRPDEAEPYYIESYETGKKMLGEKHPETVTSMVNLGSFYLKRGKLAESEAVLSRAIEIFDETMPPDHIGRGIALAQRGDVRAKRGQLAQAQVDLLAGFEILSKHQDLSSPRLRRLVESIAASFEAQGAPAKAAEWRAKLPGA